MATEKEIRDALEGVLLSTSMLEAADGASGRFSKLIKQMKLTQKLLNEFKELLAKPAPEVPASVPAPQEDIIRPKSGSVTPLRPTDIGLDTRRKPGGKVTPAK